MKAATEKELLAEQENVCGKVSVIKFNGREFVNRVVWCRQQTSNPTKILSDKQLY